MLSGRHSTQNDQENLLMYILPGFTTYQEIGGVITVRSEIYQSEIEISDTDIKEEFYQIAQKGCDALSTPMTKILHEQKLLVDESDIKDCLDEYRSVLDKTFRVTLMPTEGCNFRCPYCYENHKPTTMTRHLFEQILAYISDQCTRFENVFLSWFGGEPTLCADNVIEASSAIRELYEKHGFRFQSDMTTNGYLLNEKLFHELYTAGVTRYQITIDGRNHDRTRPHVSGRGTLEVIMKNIASITRLPKDVDFHVTLRHNILSGDEDYEWYDHLAEVIGADKRFSVFVKPVGDWGGDSVKMLDICPDSEKDGLVQRHVEYLGKIGLQCDNNVKEPFSNVCYANYPNAMIFRADGKIEKCTIALDHPMNKIGYVDPKLGVIIDQDQQKRWGFHGYRETCAKCTQVTSCLNMKCSKNRIIDGIDCSVCDDFIPQTFLR